MTEIMRIRLSDLYYGNFDAWGEIINIMIDTKSSNKALKAKEYLKLTNKEQYEMAYESI